MIHCTNPPIINVSGAAIWLKVEEPEKLDKSGIKKHNTVEATSANGNQKVWIMICDKIMTKGLYSKLLRY